MDKTTPETADTDYTPTPEDLREVAEFLRQRSLDEARAAGRMDSYRNAGVTLQVNIPSSAFVPSRTEEVRENAEAWLEQHSPDRFMELTGRLASLGDALASAGVDAISDTSYRLHMGAYRQQSIWWSLTRAARLWDTHPDFKPLWAEDAGVGE